jgi:serine/threonine protein phosphatase PrpC
MEDRVVTGRAGDALVVSVFDGHGGATVAERAAAQVLGLVGEALGRGLEGGGLWQAVFAGLDAPVTGCGATATLLLLRGEALSAAWVGDSRAVLVDRTGCRVLTPDHRIDRADELARVTLAGAAIVPPYAIDPRTSRGLMMTRALGDRELRRVGIVAEPEWVSLPLEEDTLGFVVATDGLWDVVDNDEAAAACRGVDPEIAARDLVRLVGQREGVDNVSVVVGRFA